MKYDHDHKIHPNLVLSTLWGPSLPNSEAKKRKLACCCCLCLKSEWPWREKIRPRLCCRRRFRGGKEEGGWHGEGKEGRKGRLLRRTHQISTAAQVVKFYSSIVVAAAAVVVVPFKSSCSLHVSLSLCSKVLHSAVGGHGFWSRARK